jgi:hypothetical protein
MYVLSSHKYCKVFVRSRCTFLVVGKPCCSFAPWIMKFICSPQSHENSRCMLRSSRVSLLAFAMTSVCTCGSNRIPCIRNDHYLDYLELQASRNARKDPSSHRSIVFRTKLRGKSMQRNAFDACMF